MAIRAALLAVVVWGMGHPMSAQELRIGEISGPDEFIFGRVSDVGADSLGRIVVIDNQQPEPRAYAADGTYIGPLGRSGQGPGEFLGPSSVDLSPGGRVAVVDGRNGRVTLLRLTDSAPELEGTFRPDRTLGGICWLGERLFGLSVHGTHEPLLVEYDTDGRVVREFGERIQPTGRLASIYGAEPPHTLNQGEIDCDAGSQTIAYASWLTGEVRLYSGAGELRWVTTVPDWMMLRIQRTGGICCMFGPPEEGYYHRVRALMIDGDAVVISTDLVGIEEGSEAHSLRRSDGGLVDVESGAPFYHERLPDGRRVAHRLLPFSQVVIGR